MVGEGEDKPADTGKQRVQCTARDELQFSGSSTRAYD